MIDKILNANKAFNLFKNGDEVIVACSGGADSVALLYVLKENAEALGIKVSAAHFNHQIRGAEADRDEDFVRRFCEQNNIHLYFGCGNVPKYAKENSISVELAARELRYEFFNSLPKGALIATAHHADDNLETMLFNLTRGTALTGLCGIPAKRDRFIRPLLMCARKDIEEFCNEKELEYVIDSSNLSAEHTRNFIRHNIIPRFREINNSVELSAFRTACSLKDDEEFLSSFSSIEFKKRLKDDKLDLSDFGSLHKAIAKRILKEYFVYITGENPDFLHITQLYEISLGGSKISLPGNFEAEALRGFLTISPNSEFIDTKFEVEITQSTYKAENNKNVHSLLLKNSFDCDKIVGKLEIGTRKAGDKVRIKGRNGTKTLKKLYNEYHIPLSHRKNLPVIFDDVGIVWIANIGVAERCAVTRDTKKVYSVKFKAF